MEEEGTKMAFGLHWTEKEGRIGSNVLWNDRIQLEKSISYMEGQDRERKNENYGGDRQFKSIYKIRNGKK